MYAEASLLLPFLQGFSSQEAHHFHLPDDEELLCHFHTNIPNETHLLGNLLQTSTISEYDLGGEGDLFKAPEPIIEEPMLPLDPMTAAMSMISGGEDFITAETDKVTDMDTIQNELLSEVFYECKKDILAKSAFEESFSELSDVKIPAVQMEADPVAERNWVVAEGLIQKSVSSGCLTSMESINGCTMRPNFLPFQMDFGAAFRIRRAYSEGDIQTLGNNNNTLSNTSIAHSSFERQLTVGDDKIEDRRQKLSRYRNKKTKRNFDRKIKYACRKALADSQPRVRGRFAKTEECEFAKPHK